MEATVATVLLRDGEDAAAGEEATRATIQEALGPGAIILTDPREALGAADILAFARPGDRWLPGALAARLRPLLGRPDMVLCVAAHDLVDDHSRVVTTVHPPFPPIDPAELLLRPSIEPSAVLVRSAALDPAALDLLARPHGDAVLWSRLTAVHGLLPTNEVAARVPLQPDRHAVGAARSTAVLLEAARGPEADAPGGTMARRELLRRLYLDASQDAEYPDLAALLNGDPARAAAVVADLQWALERQREALWAERVSWPQGIVAQDDALPDPGPDLVEARHETNWLHREVAVRDRQIAHLHAEIQLRDLRLAGRGEDDA